MKKGLVYFSFILFFWNSALPNHKQSKPMAVCGYTMFKVMKRWVADISGENKQITEVHPGTIIPWEFFRAGSLIFIYSNST